MSDVLHYYLCFTEREMRSREAWSTGKKEELEIWTYHLILAVSHLVIVLLPAYSSKDISCVFNMVEKFLSQALVCYVTLDLIRVFFF